MLKAEGLKGTEAPQMRESHERTLRSKDAQGTKNDDASGVKVIQS